MWYTSRAWFTNFEGGGNDCDKKRGLMAFINYKLSYSNIFTLLYTYYIYRCNKLYVYLMISFFEFEN